MSDDVVTAELWIDGKRFADTAAAWDASEPVALADLELTWGRETSVDQPETSTMSFRIVDRGTADAILAALDVGMPVRLWARGNIAPTYQGNFNIQQDGGFETAAPGGPTDRVHVWNSSTAPASSAVVTPGSPDGIGTQIVHFETAQVGDIINIPPAPYDDGAADAWLPLPQYQTGDTWQIAVAALRVGKGMQVMLRGRTFSTPDQREGQKYAGAGTVVTGTGAYRLEQTTATGTVQDVDDWLGTSIRIISWLGWEGGTGTWADQPPADTWETYTDVDIDRVGVYAPSDAAVRGVVVFAGRISDIRLALDGGDWVATCTAVDLTAELANRYIGDEPWPAETVAERVDRIYTAASIVGLVELVTDDTIAEHTASWRDVDHRATAALLAEQAAAIDFVLWPASASTIIPYLWFEDPALRSQVGMLEVDAGGYVVIGAGASNRIGGKTSLDGCDLLSADVSFLRDVSDVLTIVDATWLEQTVDELGNPAPTEHTETVRDVAAVDGYGERRLGIATMTTAAAEAVEIADGILLRTRQPQWRAEGLTWDFNVTPPPRGPKTAQALDLLDGTIRLGRGIVVDDVTWPGGDAVTAYLDGGHYVYDGAWRLELRTNPVAGFGTSAAWDDLDPGWPWQQMYPTMAWADLWGVAGPLSATLEPSR